MACSRPPPPTTRAFMVAMPRRRPSGFLLSRTGDEPSNSFRGLHELEEVPLRIFERHDAAPGIGADLADELHPLFPEWLDVGSDDRGLQRQDSRYGAVGPAAFEAISAADTVFERSIAIVIGPTPPGTGEMAFALSFTASKSTSPTVRYPPFAPGSGMRLMPTSITTAPLRTMSALRKRGEPIATARMS